MCVYIEDLSVHAILREALEAFTIYVLILLYMCPHICVLILLNTCPHTATQESVHAILHEALEAFRKQEQC